MTPPPRAGANDARSQFFSSGLKSLAFRNPSNAHPRDRVRTGSQAIWADKRHSFAHIVLTSLFLLFALLTTPALANPIDAKALERFVIQDCGSCHGLTLKGGLGPDIRPQSIEHYDPEVLQSVILNGVPGTPMPPWRPLLSEAEAAWIADYLLKGEAP